MGVRDLWRGSKVLYWCKRLAELSGKFCVGVRDPLALALGTGEPARAQDMCVNDTTSDPCHTWYRHV